MAPSPAELRRLMVVGGGVAVGAVPAAIIGWRGVAEAEGQGAILAQQAFAAGKEAGRRELEDQLRIAAEYDSREARVRRAFMAVEDFEKNYKGEPITQELMEVYVESPLMALFKASFGHIPWINDQLSVVVKNRSAFDEWLRQGSQRCAGADFDPSKISGRTTASSLGPAEITVPDNLGNIRDYRVLKLHELVHAATRPTYTYYPKSGTGGVHFWGLSITDTSLDQECPAEVWQAVNEAGADWLVGEMNLGEDEEVAVKGRGGDLAWERMRAERVLVEEVAGMSRIEFAGGYFMSQPLMVEGELDRRITERFGIDGLGKPRQLVREGLNRINAGNITDFYQLVEKELKWVRE